MSQCRCICTYLVPEIVGLLPLPEVWGQILSTLLSTCSRYVKPSHMIVRSIDCDARCQRYENIDRYVQCVEHCLVIAEVEAPYYAQYVRNILLQKLLSIVKRFKSENIHVLTDDEDNPAVCYSDETSTVLLWLHVRWVKHGDTIQITVTPVLIHCTPPETCDEVLSNVEYICEECFQNPYE